MGGKTKQSSTSTTTNQAAIGQYNAAKSSLPSSYTPLTGQQIQQYQNPFQSNVVDALISNNDRARQMAMTDVDSRAAKAGAFGNSGYNLERAATNAEYDRNSQSALANLLYQGFNTSAGIAQQQNAAQNQYPLALQALLGQLAQGTQTTTNSQGTMKQPMTMDEIGKGVEAAGSAAQLFALFSDVRLKRDIQPLGKRNGRNWYSFKYLWSDEPQEGVMAQENPDIAFEGPGGFLMVDYGAI